MKAPNQQQPALVPVESAEELYEGAPCGFLSTTPDGRIVKVNQTLLNWIGAYRKDLLSGGRFADLLTVGGRIFYETHFAPLLQLHGEVGDAALDLRCNGRAPIPVLISAVQKRDESGCALLNRITLFKASERHAYEHELLLAKKRAEEAATELERVNAVLSDSNAALLKVNEELGQFAYAASHDLQEPLRTMTVYSQLLAMKYKDELNEDAKGLIANIVEGSGRMTRLISDLLSWSQTQGSPLRLRRNELKQILEGALESLESAIAQSNAIVTHDELPVLTVDAARMAQVFQNLIGNAIKYGRPGQQPLIHVSANKGADDEWLFSVEDNGLGFEPRYAETVFVMFRRLHGKEIPGTGIGLATCKKIIEAHGGRIWATSTPGMGSRFSFTIPGNIQG